MKKKFDVVATTGKYKDGQGNDKKRYLNIGAVFESEDGRMSMKLEAIPVGLEWSGWASFYEPDRKQGGQAQSQPAQRNEAQSSNENESLPF